MKAPAHLRAIEHQCAVCHNLATVQLFDVDDIGMAFYCLPHGELALQRLWESDPEHAPPSYKPRPKVVSMAEERRLEALAKMAYPTRPPAILKAERASRHRSRTDD